MQQSNFSDLNASFSRLNIEESELSMEEVEKRLNIMEDLVNKNDELTTKNKKEIITEINTIKTDSEKLEKIAKAGINIWEVIKFSIGMENKFSTVIDGLIAQCNKAVCAMTKMQGYIEDVSKNCTAMTQCSREMVNEVKSLKQIIENCTVKIDQANALHAEQLSRMQEDHDRKFAMIMAAIEGQPKKNQGSWQDLVNR